MSENNEKLIIKYPFKIDLEKDDEAIFSVINFGGAKKILIPKDKIELTQDVDNDMLILTIKEI